MLKLSWGENGNGNKWGIELFVTIRSKGILPTGCQFLLSVCGRITASLLGETHFCLDRKPAQSMHANKTPRTWQRKEKRESNLLESFQISCALPIMLLCSSYRFRNQDRTQNTCSANTNATPAETGRKDAWSIHPTLGEQGPCNWFKYLQILYFFPFYHGDCSDEHQGRKMT